MGKALAVAAALLLLAAGAARAAPSEGMSLYGDLKYKPGFTHFDYANTDAPIGGTIRYAAIGTYDTLNPFVINGVPAAGINLIFDTLTAASEDEPASEYGLVAETMDLAPDKMSVLYTLRKQARFHDGTPITPADVIWTFETLQKQGLPAYREYYGDVTKVVQEGERGVRFYFKSAKNRELPQILGQMPVLSKTYWAGRDFSKTTLTPPLGSGPYTIKSLDPGRSITYARVRIIGGPLSRSTRAATISTRSATIIIATRRSRSKPSRPDNMTCASKTRQRIGRPAMTARPCAPA